MPSSKASRSTPNVITETRHLDGWRDPQWVMRPLESGESVAIQQYLVGLEERLRPVSREGLRVLFAKYANHFRSDRSAGEIAQLFDDYAAELGQFSQAHVAEAFSEMLRAKPWFAKLSELREILMRLDSHDRVLRHRARVLLGMEEPASWERPLARRSHVEEHLGAMPQLEAKIAELPPGLSEATQRLFEARQKRLGDVGPLFGGRRSA